MNDSVDNEYEKAVWVWGWRVVYVNGMKCDWWIIWKSMGELIMMELNTYKIMKNVELKWLSNIQCLLKDKMIRM